MAISAHGTALDVDAGAGFEHVADVLDIDGPGISLATEAYYSDDPTQGPVVLTGNHEPGEVTFDVNIVNDSGQIILRSAALQRLRLAFRIVFATGGATFFGFVTTYKPTAPVDGILRASVTVTVDGLPTFT